MKSLSLDARLWLFAGAILAVIAYLGYTFYDTEYVEYSQKVERLDGDIRKKKGELRQILAQKQRLKDLEAEIELANVEFSKLQEMFPDEELIPRQRPAIFAHQIVTIPPHCLQHAQTRRRKQPGIIHQARHQRTSSRRHRRPDLKLFFSPCQHS